MPGCLYVLATPLGNLGDLSSRAAEVLGSVDLVAAEDTRRTRTLLAHIGATPKIVSFHAHSKPSRLEQLVERLVAGDALALVTDAGTPAISDPGANLVRRAREAGVEVASVPGPSAVATALSVSGLPADRFTFFGFLPRKGADRNRLLQAIAENRWTSVVFEAPLRLERLLVDLAEACGGGTDREAVIARELTKLHEEIRAGTLAELAGYYREAHPRGEITVVVAGGPQERDVVDDDLVRSRAQELLRAGESRRDVAALLADEMNLSRRDTYRVVNSL